MYQNIPTKCRLGEVRLSYVHLTAPYQNDPSSKPKYSATLLVPKSNPALKQDMDAAIAAAIEQGVHSKWNGKRPPVVAQPVWDGDGVRANGEAFGPECKGMWVVTASTNAEDKSGNPLPPPMVVHISNVRVRLAPEDVYSGMWGFCTVNFAPYDSNGKRGVGCYLNNVCKTRDGDPLGMGRSDAADDFADLEQPGAVDQMGGQPQQYAPQQYGAQQQPAVYTAPANGIDPLTGQPYQPAPQQYAPPANGVNPLTGQPYQPAPQQYAPPANGVNPLTGQPYNAAPYYTPTVNYDGTPS